MNREQLFREAIQESGRRIFQICRHFFGPGDDAHDAYQEILLKVWLNLDAFRGEAQMKTWIHRIAVNVCLTFAAQAKRNSSIFVPFTQSDNGENLSENEGESEEAGMKLRFFQTFMQKLSAADRTLVSLYLENLDTAEMAQTTGLSEANVRVKIHRIKKQIQQEWEVHHGTR